MDKKIKALKNTIEQSNLIEEDKSALVKILSEKKINWDKFLWRLMVSIQVAAEICKALHIDISDFFK